MKRAMGKDLHFQQDNAPAHSARNTVAWLTEVLPNPLIKHPARSPDLNPIEPSWKTLHQAAALKEPKDLDDLKKKLTRAWATIPQEKFDNQIKHLN